MATKTTLPQDDAPEQEKRYGPHHRAFTWVYTSQPDARAEFTALTYDVSRGIETVLDVVMNAQLHEQSHGYDYDDPDDLPLFGRGDTERLMRLALASAKMLSGQAETVISEINRRNSKGKK